MQPFLFTINIMVNIKQFPQLWNNWSPGVRYDPYIFCIMSKTRYLKISQYLHLSDSVNAPSKNDSNYNYLYEVHPIIDLLSEKYIITYLPGKNLSVDEVIIGYVVRVSVLAIRSC